MQLRKKYIFLPKIVVGRGTGLSKTEHLCDAFPMFPTTVCSCQNKSSSFENPNKVHPQFIVIVPTVKNDHDSTRSATLRGVPEVDPSPCSVKNACLKSIFVGAVSRNSHTLTEQNLFYMKHWRSLSIIYHICHINLIIADTKGKNEAIKWFQRYVWVEVINV